jgi:hypothetical protein
MHVNGIRVIGVLGIVVIFLVFLTVPPDVINDISNEPSVTHLESPEDIVNEARSSSQLSVVETNVKFTETDSSKITLFLDSQNIDSPLSTEKFGIITDVALFDSNNQKSTVTNVFGVNEIPDVLSVTDAEGIPLDFGGNIQVTFDSITQSLPKSVTSWGTVKFFLDDRLLDTKKLWSSYQSNQRQSMSILSNINFERDVPNLVLDEFPVPPSFIDREKRNYTYNFSDENLTDGSHVFRVVFYDMNAVIDSKNFNWKGENIVYELKFNVDNNMITKESEMGNGLKSTVFKSDNRFTYSKTDLTLSVNHNGQLLYFYSQTSFPHIMNVYVNDKLVKMIDNSTPSSEFLFPRDSQLKVIIDGKTVYDEKQPLTQTNHHMSLSSNLLKKYWSWGSCSSTGGGRASAHGTIVGGDFGNIISTSFGYSDSFDYHVGSTIDVPYPCR